MPRRTTRNTDSLVRGLGLSSGQGLSDIADGPVQPVINIGDLSSFETETFPARAVAATLITTVSNNAASYSITSLGQSGIVIEDLMLETILVGIGPIFPAAPEASWVVVNYRDFPGSVSRFTMTTETVERVANFGGPAVRSRVRTGTRAGPATLGVYLPAQFQFQPGISWFVPPGYDLAMMINSVGTAGSPVLGSVEMSFREVSGIGSGGFVDG